MVKNKKIVSYLTAGVMMLGVLPNVTAQSVKAAEPDDVLWKTYYEINFDKLTALEDDSNLVYNAGEGAVTLTDDPTGGKYLTLTPAYAVSQVDNHKASGRWCLDVRAFDTAAAATSPVRLEYKVKFTTLETGDGTGNWAPYSGVHAKSYIGTKRGWAARLSPYYNGLMNKTDRPEFKGNSDWYTIAEEVKGGKWTTYLYQGSELIDSVEVSAAALLTEYLIGCDGTGKGIYIDDIKVSYGIVAPKNLELNFDGNTPGEAFTHDKVYQQNITSTVMNTPEDGNFLRMTCTDSSSATKNSFRINAFDNAKNANTVTVEYRARIPECNPCPGTDSTNDSYTKHPSLNTKFKGTSNTWAARVSHYKVQANSKAVRDEDWAGTGWFTVKHVIDNTQAANNLTTTITYNGKSHSNTATYAPAAINYYELVVTDVPIMDYTDVDDIKVTYAFDEAEKIPEATVAVYAGNAVQSDLTAVSTLADKVVISFSEEMDTSTITQNSVYAEDGAGSKVGCSASFDAAHKVYTMTLSSLLPAGKYKVVVTADAKSAAGVAAEPKTVEFTVVSGQILPSEQYSEDYLLDFDNLTALPADDSIIRFNSETTPTLVTEDGGNKYLSVNPSGSTAVSDGIGTSTWSVVYTNIDTDTTADKVTISYDVKLSNPKAEGTGAYGDSSVQDKFYLVGDNARKWAIRIGGKAYNMFGQAGNIATSLDDPSDWFTVSYEYDTKTKVITGTVSQKGAVAASAAMNASAIIRALLMGTASSEPIYIDNIKTSYTYNAPTVTKDSVTLLDSKSMAQNNWNDIALLTKSVNVDFGAVMDTSTLNSDNVYIIKKGDSKKIEYIANYQNGVYTMGLTEALAEKTTYTIFVSKNVTNVKGDGLSDDLSLDFTTGMGQRTSELIGVNIGGTKVTSVSGLTANATAQVEVDYSNTTGTPQTFNVIIAYYSGDILKTAEIIKAEDVDASIITMTYKYDFTVLSDMSDITAVKIMAWSAFGEMLPLSDPTDL